jgi:hypothetical protein
MKTSKFTCNYAAKEYISGVETAEKNKRSRWPTRQAADKHCKLCINEKPGRFKRYHGGW